MIYSNQDRRSCPYGYCPHYLNADENFETSLNHLAQHQLKLVFVGEVGNLDREGNPAKAVMMIFENESS